MVPLCHYQHHRAKSAKLPQADHLQTQLILSVTAIQIFEVALNSATWGLAQECLSNRSQGYHKIKRILHPAWDHWASSHSRIRKLIIVLWKHLRRRVIRLITSWSYSAIERVTTQTDVANRTRFKIISFHVTKKTIDGKFDGKLSRKLCNRE